MAIGETCVGDVVFGQFKVQFQSVDYTYIYIDQEVLSAETDIGCAREITALSLVAAAYAVLILVTPPVVRQKCTLWRISVGSHLQKEYVYTLGRK